jgi:uncharacterized alpha-E superfamily protein
LFWLGRYIERAADTTRMLDVAYNTQLERTASGQEQVWRDLLRVLYLEEAFAAGYGDEVTTVTMNRFLVFDLENPASVAASVREARSNVMNVRDAVPSELLETVNRLHTRLAGGSLTGYVANPHEMYEAIGEHSRAISGAITDAMSRDDRYRFLMLGRWLERAEMTGRMIDVNRDTEDAATWLGVLRSLSGFHAFTQAHGPLAPAGEVVTFLLHESSFPFSVLHCLQRAGAMATAVSGTGQWQSPRVLGRVTARLEYADVPPLGSPQLAELLESLEDGIRHASEALHQDLYQFGGEPALYSFEAL